MTHRPPVAASALQVIIEPKAAISLHPNQFLSLRMVGITWWQINAQKEVQSHVLNYWGFFFFFLLQNICYRNFRKFFPVVSASFCFELYI